jgi:hypothetical protein
MNKEETIKEFIEATPDWYKSIMEDLRKKPCALCGIIPLKMLELSKELSQAQQAERERIIKIIRGGIDELKRQKAFADKDSEKYYIGAINEFCGLIKTLKE